MSFSPTQYDHLIKKIEKGLQTAVSDADAAVRAIGSTLSLIPQAEAAAVEAILNQFVSEMTQLVPKVEKALAQAPVPVMMWQWANQWYSMADQAGASASDLQGLDQYSSEWQGIAGGKYKKAVAGQEPAVDQIQTMANQIGGGCRGTAVVGFAFYTGVLVALVSLIIGILQAAAGAAETPETLGLSDLAAAKALLSAVDIALTSFAAALFIAELGCQQQADTFRQAAEHSDKFGPNNTWPGATG